MECPSCSYVASRSYSQLAAVCSLLLDDDVNVDADVDVDDDDDDDDNEMKMGARCGSSVVGAVSSVGFVVG
eukprot:4435220-Amphidinium_carterae.2